jgi:hypothetical protein
MEVNLCGGGHCPKVVAKKDLVEIGEEGNLVKLRPEEWNVLVESIEEGKLRKIYRKDTRKWQ